MKMVMLVIVLAALTVSGVFAMGVQGDGNVINREIPLTAFENLRISGSPQVNFIQSENCRVTVEIDSNLERALNISVRDRTLDIGTKRGWHIQPTKFNVDVYSPSLSEVSVAGSAGFAARDKIITNTFRLDLAGSGRISGDVECRDYSATISGSGAVNGSVVCDNYRVRISGSGKVKTSGNAQDANIGISGSGSVDGRELNCENAEINISGSGDIRIWVTQNLQATVSGSGNLIYRGNPKINYKASGSGTIQSE